MADMVIVPVPGIGCLALESEAYRKALAEGARLAGTTPSAAQAEEPLVDADTLSAALAVPVTWIEQAARTGRIPSLGIGRYVRFRRSAVEAVLAARSAET